MCIHANQTNANQRGEPVVIVGTPLCELRTLLSESGGFGVDLSVEAAPVKAEVDEVVRWTTNHSAVISAFLRACPVNDVVDFADVSNMAVPMSTDAESGSRSHVAVETRASNDEDGHYSNIADVSSGFDAHQTTALTVRNLNKLCSSADILSADFVELRLVPNAYSKYYLNLSTTLSRALTVIKDRVSEWLNQVKQICPKKMGTKRRAAQMLLHDEEGKVFASNALDLTDASSSSATVTAQLQLLENLRKSGLALGIDLREEIERIEQVCQLYMHYHSAIND